MDITTTDGRRIRAHESGARDGRPVLWLPGAGTRGDLAAPLPRLATTHGLRLMSFDRPGYGGSEPAPVRTIAEAVADAGTPVTISVVGGEPVDAGSALMIMTLGAGKGASVEVSGDDEAAAQGRGGVAQWGQRSGRLAVARQVA